MNLVSFCKQVLAVYEDLSSLSYNERKLIEEAYEQKTNRSLNLDRIITDLGIVNTCFSKLLHDDMYKPDYYMNKKIGNARIKR